LSSFLKAEAQSSRIGSGVHQGRSGSSGQTQFTPKGGGRFLILRKTSTTPENSPFLAKVMLLVGQQSSPHPMGCLKGGDVQNIIVTPVGMLLWWDVCWQTPRPAGMTAMSLTHPHFLGGW